MREGGETGGGHHGASGMSLYVRPVSISRDVDVNYNSVRVGRGEGREREGERGVVQGVVLFIKRQ